MTTAHSISPDLVFKDIPGHSGYRASSDGRIWTCWGTRRMGYARGAKKVQTDRWRPLKGFPRKEDGRLRYTLRCDDGSYRRAYGGTFVLEAFVGPCPEGMECCHKDGCCTNDASDNVRWGTSESNKADMLEHGTRQRGEQINTAKIAEDDVREIRRIGYPLRQHAERYGISETMVSLIIRRKAWIHVN